MADDLHDASSKNNEPVFSQEKEDAETRAARRELKQSSISDTPSTEPASSADDKVLRPDTPSDNVREDGEGDDDDLKEKVASPKKKRAHDQLDGDKEVEENDANSVASTDSSKDRTTRTEPEKKRHRDQEISEESSKLSQPEAEKPAPSPTKAAAPTSASASAFAASGFGKLATSNSPFATFGADKGGAFGTSGTPPLSSFASPAPAATSQTAPAPPKMTFGDTGAKSPFSGVSSGANGFGSAFGGSSFGGSTFGSAFGGAKPLGSFAAPGAKPLQNTKPARPFGAPESDAEDDDDEEDDEDESQPDETERLASPEKESEEKKRYKLQKIEVNDGEAGESTILSVRAKMFHLDKEAGWKERGAGMLKINVPSACVEFDSSDTPVPGSFDASGLSAETEDEDNKTAHAKVVRLLMRQDQTHRVILNTAILPAMKFTEKASLKSVGILFTAFEGSDAKPVSITMRMSAANAKAFMNEIRFVQNELQSNQ
ncbi:hypothetical protein S7711_00711 [Stachybotrys chartarum IBT 7711]|uniref:RanBD1 domain-containing protein n=1 Tax=Stachybotrys chartarum (strain CBS 109288 / IBT 7711) TaxID=1280523 RepID=A0A084AZY6_STACB|nr:hypothetical protein S7711_00711 [Stachybotrys chartarum IBT 7711]KFA73624.1 hypothetical protein S40288_02595 [Stachybotrys chartarum IBT 40288]